MALTAVSAHERASTIPRLHSAKTVAWGLLNWGKYCMIVVCHWSKLAWPGRASLRGVVVVSAPHKMPSQGSSVIFRKPYPCKGEGGGRALTCARVSRPGSPFPTLDVSSTVSVPGKRWMGQSVQDAFCCRSLSEAQNAERWGTPGQLSTLLPAWYARRLIPLT